MYHSLLLLLGTINLKNNKWYIQSCLLSGYSFIPLIKCIFLVEGIKLLLFPPVVVIWRLSLLSQPTPPPPSPSSSPQLLLLLLSLTFLALGFSTGFFLFYTQYFPSNFLECSFWWQGNCQLQKALSSLQTPKQHFPSSSACQEKDFTPPSALYFIKIGSLLWSHTEASENS